MRLGTYVNPFSGPAGAKAVAVDVAAIEAMLEPGPNYPPGGAYDTAPNVGFRWWFVSLGSTTTASTPTPPELTAAYDTTCADSDSLTTTTDDDCDVRDL